jgi:hypothetical protein
MADTSIAASIDHWIATHAASDRRVMEDILSHLAEWQQALLGDVMPAPFFADQEPFRHELAEKLVTLLTYVVHGHHPWFDDDAEFQLGVARRAQMQQFVQAYRAMQHRAMEE